MILTQSYMELGFPRELGVVGACIFSVEPQDGQGYGLSSSKTLEAAVAELREKHGEDAVLLKARFEWLPGNAHHSYGRRVLRVTGDLYRRRDPAPGPVDAPRPLPQTLTPISRVGGTTLADRVEDADWRKRGD